MQSAILSCIAIRQFVTFALLDREIPGFRGDLAMYDSERQHLLLWPALSQRALNAMQRLLSTGRIHLHPASARAYLTDGQWPAMDCYGVGESDTSEGWMPACFCTYPREGSAQQWDKKIHWLLPPLPFGNVSVS